MPVILQWFSNESISPPIVDTRQGLWWCELSQLGVEGASGIYWAETRDAARHPHAQDGPAPHSEERSGPRCQQCQGGETRKCSKTPRTARKISFSLTMMIYKWGTVINITVAAPHFPNEETEAQRCTPLWVTQPESGRNLIWIRAVGSRAYTLSSCYISAEGTGRGAGSVPSTPTELNSEDPSLSPRNLRLLGVCLISGTRSVKPCKLLFPHP